MAKFKKQILGVGKLYTGDGEELDITPERLQHWDTQFKRLKANGQRCPMHFDHPSDTEAMFPLAKDKFTKTRGAYNTVGELVDFALASDGQSAVLTGDFFDAKAIRALEADKVSLSPVILDRFRDGSKNEYEDIVAGADLVIRPVDHRQGAFTPAEGTIACALSLNADTKKPKVYLMATDDDPKDDDEKKPPVDGDGDGETNEDDTEQESEEELTGKNAKIARCVSSLAAYGIQLAEDTDSGTFFDRLDAALTALAAAKAGDEMAPDNPTEAPMVATMSLESKTALCWANTQYRKSLEVRLDALNSSGRCKPDEYKSRKTQTGVVALSLDAKTGQPSPGKLEDWITDREQLPAGTFHTAEQKARLLSLEEKQPPRMEGEWTEKDADEAVAGMFGAKK